MTEPAATPDGTETGAAANNTRSRLTGSSTDSQVSARGASRPWIMASAVICIFMTAIDDDATRKEAMNAGCVAYLKKPFAPHLLLDALKKAVA